MYIIIFEKMLFKNVIFLNVGKWNGIFFLESWPIKTNVSPSVSGKQWHWGCKCLKADRVALFLSCNRWVTLYLLTRLHPEAGKQRYGDNEGTVPAALLWNESQSMYRLMKRPFINTLTHYWWGKFILRYLAVALMKITCFKLKDIGNVSHGKTFVSIYDGGC